MQPSRYHPVLVALHWLLAFLIVAALIVGFIGLAATPNTDPEKIGVLRLHMAGGMLIFALTGIRFLVRMTTASPAPASTGHRHLDRLALLSHYGFYVLVLLMVGTGYATAILAGLPQIVFGGSDAPLPPSFATYPTRTAHGVVGALLSGLIVLHVLIALYHQIVKRDHLLRRMFFGRRA